MGYQYDDEDESQEGPAGFLDLIAEAFGPPKPGEEDYVPAPEIIDMPTEPAPAPLAPMRPKMFPQETIAGPTKEERICHAAIALVRAAEKRDQERYDLAFVRLTREVNEP